MWLAGNVQANKLCHPEHILLRLFWQGLVAGMNAARRAQGLETVTLPRNSSYIGTLVDDLVTKVNLACSHLVFYLIL